MVDVSSADPKKPGISPQAGFQTPSVPPPVSPVTKSPPPQPVDTTLVDSIISQSQSAQNVQSSQPQTVSVQTPSGSDVKPKKRSSFGGMLAGVLILMITLPIGIYFISQKQSGLTEQRSCAAGDDVCVGSPGPYANITVPPGFTCNDQSCCNQYANKTCWWNLNGNGICLCTGTQCTNWGSGWGACHLDTCRCIQEQYCQDGNNNTYQIRECIDTACTPCDETPIPTDKNTPTLPPGQTATLTPSPIPGQCSQIRIYKDNVVIDPNTLSVGDVVQIACSGTNADMARIRINGGAWGETSVKNSHSEYYISYTIPSGVTSFTVEAEIFTNNEWK
jgi:hypothetical protein